MRLTAEGINHRFGRAGEVLSDVSLAAAPGRMLAITGPSGSGKSTLLSVLGLILKPDRGTIYWGGSVISTPRAAGRARAEFFSWITQTANVFGARTAVDNVAIGLLGKRVDHRAARRAAGLALEAVGLAAHARKPARLLSGGETQRLVIARAILARKPVVLADEPTGQLDRRNSELVTATLRSAAAAGAVVVVATHDSQVADACDERIELVDGRATWLR